MKFKTKMGGDDHDDNLVIRYTMYTGLTTLTVNTTVSMKALFLVKGTLSF